MTDTSAVPARRGEQAEKGGPPNILTAEDLDEIVADPWKVHLLNYDLIVATLVHLRDEIERISGVRTDRAV